MCLQLGGRVTELGNRCLLLEELGLDAYWNTEEEILKVLTESAECAEYLDICKRSSRCQAFWEKFQQGKTPFLERDPIRLYEYDGKYWVSEGKHRVCMAKRSGVERIEAYVFAYPNSDHSLLPDEGSCGRYAFQYTIVRGMHPHVKGKTAALWVDTPRSEQLHEFDFHPTALTARQDTKGAWVSILPGVSYRVTCIKKLCGLFLSNKRVVVEAEVLILPEHVNTKVWLLEGSAADVLAPRSLRLSQAETLYRSGCWRAHNLKASIDYPPY